MVVARIIVIHNVLRWELQLAYLNVCMQNKDDSWRFNNKESHPDKKIGFSKVLQLRPKECVLAGASGTYSVCACAVHQDVKLMMAGSRLETLSGDQLKHY